MSESTELVKTFNGGITANSKTVADVFNVKGGHRYLKKKIKEIIEDNEEFGVQNFLHSSYKSQQNKTLECYEMTKDGFCFLAMGLTGREADKWKIKYIDAFNKMSEHIAEQSDSSLMIKLNEAIDVMEKDSQVASKMGKGLSEWKRVRKEHMENIEHLHNKAQVVMNFK